MDMVKRGEWVKGYLDLLKTHPAPSRHVKQRYHVVADEK